VLTTGLDDVNVRNYSFHRDEPRKLAQHSDIYSRGAEIEYRSGPDYFEYIFRGFVQFLHENCGIGSEMKTPTVPFTSFSCHQRLVRLFDSIESQVPTVPLNRM
jgi:hypothetical protein